jgi:hypothetical protein
MAAPENVAQDLPPHDLEAEMATVGSLMLDPEALAAVEDVVGADDFYSRENGLLFRTIAAMVAEGQPVDTVLLADRCLADGTFEAVGGVDHFYEILDATPSAARARHYASVVAGRSKRRRAIAAAERAARVAADPSCTAEDVDAAMAALTAAQAGIGPDGRQAVVVRLDSVQQRPLEWLWPGRVPLGKLTLLSGDPALGKSLLTLDMAARVSAGQPWPDAPRTPTAAGSVVLLSAEDDAADTICPRLEAAGADLSRVVEVRAVRTREDGRGRAPSLATDLPALERAIADVGDVRLVVIDPLSAYLGETDSHRNAEVRALLAPLQALAECSGAAIVAVSHLNKNSGVSAMYRTMGSLAFVAAARTAWAVQRDPEDDGRVLLLSVKCNLAARTAGLAYRVAPSSDGRRVPILAWEPDPVDMTAAEALAGSARPLRAERTQSTSEWLSNLLAHGAVDSEQVRCQAREAGIGRKELTRAKEALGVRSSPGGYGRPWLWSLPGRSRELWPGERSESEGEGERGSRFR